MLGLPSPPPFPAPLQGQVGVAAVGAPAGAGVLYQGHCSPWAAHDAHEKQPAWPSVLLLFLNSPQAMGPLPHLIACTWGGAGPPPKPPLPCLGPNHWGPFAIRGLKLASPLSWQTCKVAGTFLERRHWHLWFLPQKSQEAEWAEAIQAGSSPGCRGGSQQPANGEGSPVFRSSLQIQRAPAYVGCIKPSHEPTISDAEGRESLTRNGNARNGPCCQVPWQLFFESPNAPPFFTLRKSSRKRRDGVDMPLCASFYSFQAPHALAPHLGKIPVSQGDHFLWKLCLLNRHARNSEFFFLSSERFWGFRG